MKETSTLPTYKRNEQAAKEQFRTEMVKYGLKIDRSSTGGTYRDNCMEFFDLHMVTEKLPVKGNKKLIERLEADHYWVQKWLNTIPGTPRQYVFRVCKTATIATGRADRIGRDLVELERKLHDGAAVCVSDLTARQADHIRDHFGGLLKHTCKEGLEYVALNKEAIV